MEFIIAGSTFNNSRQKCLTCIAFSQISNFNSLEAFYNQTKGFHRVLYESESKNWKSMKMHDLLCANIVFHDFEKFLNICPSEKKSITVISNLTQRTDFILRCKTNLYRYLKVFSNLPTQGSTNI